MTALSQPDLETVPAADPAELVGEMAAAARLAARLLATSTGEARTLALRAAARAIRDRADAILTANAMDMEASRASGLGEAMLDRLALDAGRVEAIARGVDDVADLPDPVGTELASWERPNGLRIARVRVPLGVIGIIYESRPNVTADAAALCLKAGNAALLRCGSESLHSSSALAACMAEGLSAAGLPETAVQLIPTRDRAAVGALLRQHEHVDVIVPRGGESLIRRVMEESRIPVFAHLQGLCHVYVDGAADLDKAQAIALNAKMRRVSICGAMETLLIDRAIAETALPPLAHALREAGCELRGDAAARALDPAIAEADEADWRTEYLAAILSIRVVDGVEAAIDHINTHGSHHTDSIVTEDAATAARFLNAVDSGIVMHNASTQFADGGEFGMGAEIGIATGKLHARGPVGAEQLTTYKYVVRGTGQVRP